jgi:hypothetical protein
MSSELIFLGEELENEYNDSEISNIITELNNKKKNLNHYNECIQLIISYYKRLCYLKNNCIKNTDMVLNIYQNATRELDEIKIKYSNLCSSLNNNNTFDINDFVSRGSSIRDLLHRKYTWNHSRQVFEENDYEVVTM